MPEDRAIPRDRSQIDEPAGDRRSNRGRPTRFPIGPFLSATTWGHRPEPIVRVGEQTTVDLVTELPDQRFTLQVVSERRRPDDLVDPKLREQIHVAVARIFHAYQKGEPGSRELFEGLEAASVALVASRPHARRFVGLPTGAAEGGPVEGVSMQIHHAVNGAVLGVAVAGRLGFGLQARRALVQGMLLRDVACERWAQEILHMPMDDCAGQHRHVEAAYDWLVEGPCSDERPWLSAGARLVVLQHHERCDGSGPRGLRGLHRVQRNYGERFNRDLMHPLAEVAGAVDAFVSMNTVRPARGAWDVSRIRRTMRDERSAFSRVVVRELLAFWTPDDIQAGAGRCERGDLEDGVEVQGTGLVFPQRFAPQRTGEASVVDSKALSPEASK
jgi:hypothetical protein